MPSLVLSEQRRKDIEAAFIVRLAKKTGLSPVRLRKAFAELYLEIPALAFTVRATKEELEAFGRWIIEKLLEHADSEDGWGGD